MYFQIFVAAEKAASKGVCRGVVRGRRGGEGVVGRVGRGHAHRDGRSAGPALAVGAAAAQRGGQGGPVLQLVVVEVKFFRNFPPLVDVEKVICAPLVGGRLLLGSHPGGAGDPDPILAVIPPIAVIPDERKKMKNSYLTYTF